MKTLVVLTLVILSITLFSFQLDKTGVKKIGADLYSISPKSNIAKADQERIKKVIVKYYKITDFSKDVDLEPLAGQQAAKGKWILHKKAVLNVVSESLIKYDKKAIPGEGSSLSSTLSKYAAK